MPAGGYRAALTFTNDDLSRVQNVLVQIEIGQSIVQNGGFETGDFTGWTLVGDTVTWKLRVYNVVATDADFPGVVHSGNFGAFLGKDGYAATLSQTVPTIPASRTSFPSGWIICCAVGVQQFSAFWNGTNFASLVISARICLVQLPVCGHGGRYQCHAGVRCRERPELFRF